MRANTSILGRPLQDHYVDDGSGNLVNLGPDRSPDIYSLVQAEVYLDHPEFGDLVHPVERKLAKTPTMTKFYGCGLKKMAKQINDALLEPTEHARDLARAVRATIKKIAPKAIEVFEWLQRLAAICAEHNVLLRWPTKQGFLVVNEYHPSDTKQMKRPVLKDGKQVIRVGKPVFRYTELAVDYKGNIKIGKAITSAAANFVHSADACHLQMIALACEREVIPLVTVHDCFATTANHARRLHEIIGEQFVDMYENYDWLGTIWQSARDALPKSVELPAIPERGNLNIKDVLNNFRAFS
jgi:DNA-directed RNA polymerase